MNTEIIEIIDHWLEDELINEAIMLTGDWGSGKTHFVKNTLMSDDVLEKHDLKPIYITLNGIKNLSDIDNKILGEKLKYGKILDSKVGKIGKVILPGAIKLIFNRKVESPALDPSIFDFSKNILIFDDLERISKNLNVEDVLGYINSLFIEHSKVKVIFIAWEAQIKPKKKYNIIKEKIIFRTVEYQLDLESTFSEIINGFKEENKDYYSFLNEKKALIITILKQAKEKNLRTLKFFLSILKKIFDSSFNKFDDVIYDSLILFTLAISIEFKKGNLAKYSDIRELPDFIKKNYLERNRHAEKDEETKKYNQEFTKKYIAIRKIKVRYEFYGSVYNLITIGYLDEEKLCKEVAPIVEYINQSKSSPSSTLISKFFNFWHMSEADFDNTVEELKGYIKTGQIEFENFATASFIFITFQKKNLLKDSPEQLENFLTEALMEKQDFLFDRIAENWVHEIRFYPDYYKDYKDAYPKLFKALDDKHEDLKKKMTNKGKNQHVEWLKNNLHERDNLFSLLKYVERIEVFNAIINFAGYSTLNERLMYIRPEIRNPDEFVEYLDQINDLCELFEKASCNKDYDKIQRSLFMNFLNFNLKEEIEKIKGKIVVSDISEK